MMRSDRGFTIVEMLAVVAIAGVLVAILLPVLAAARGSALKSGSLANSRTLTQLMLSRHEQAGAFPIPMLYPKEYRVPFAEFETHIHYGSPTDHWEVVVSWWFIFEFTEAELGSLSVLKSPGGGGTLTGYLMSASVFGDPALWSEGGVDQAALPALRRGVALEEVMFPSSKALLWDRRLGWRNEHEVAREGNDIAEPTAVAAFDGSASLRVPAEAAQPAVCHDPFRLQSHIPIPQRLHDTADGVRGRDW